MRQLMISLDKKILDPTSAAAERMQAYGQADELFIIIPASEEKTLDLSSTVHVQSTGGNKIQQFFRLLQLGKNSIRQKEAHAITVQDPFFTGLIGALLKHETGVSLEVQVHGDFFGSTYYRHGSLMNQVRYQIARVVVKRADRLRVVGERIKQSLIKLGVKPEKIEVRPVAVASDAIKSYQPRLNVHDRYPGYEKIFLVLGRLDPVKNIAWLINMFAEVVKQKPKCLLLIVGEGTELKNLKSKIQNLKLEGNIRFEGWTDDPWSYLKTADCLLFPSLSEGYGLVAIEARAAGTSVIMNNVGVANYELKESNKVTIL